MGNIPQYAHEKVYQILLWLTNDNMRKSESEVANIFFFLQEYQVIFILAVIGGYTDAAGYIKFARIFTASITGNLIQACAAIYITNGAVARILVTIAFLLGGVLGFSINTKLKFSHDWNVSSIGILLYSLVTMGFLISLAIGLTFQLQIEGNQDDLTDWRLVLAACFMGGTMGLQNATARITIPNVLPTTAMTMTLVVQSKYISDFIMLHVLSLFRGVDENRRDRLSDFFNEWVIVTRPLVAFLIGGVLGIVLITQISYYALLVPVMLLLLIISDIYFGWLVTTKTDQSIAIDLQLESKQNH